MTMHDEERDVEEAREGERVGDVEMAGETTAAAVMGGDETSPQPPVGADTLVEVAGEDEGAEDA